MFGLLNFPLSKTIRYINKTCPKRCFAYKYIYNPRYSYYILSSKCDCNIWCKYPPSTKLIR